jgi:hypothetical protein
MADVIQSTPNEGTNIVFHGGNHALLISVNSDKSVDVAHISSNPGYVVTEHHTSVAAFEKDWGKDKGKTFDYVPVPAPQYQHLRLPKPTLKKTVKKETEMKKLIFVMLCLVFVFACQAKNKPVSDDSPLSKYEKQWDGVFSQNNTEETGRHLTDILEYDIAAERQDEVVLSYQEEIEDWLADNNITGRTAAETEYKTVILSAAPQIIENMPPMKPLGKVETYDCFALGRFLNLTEAGAFLFDAYSVISDIDKEKYYPLNNVESFRSSIVFNVSDLFDNPFNEGLNADYSGEYAYLFVLFKTEDTEPVFDTQHGQIKLNRQKNFLVIPYSFYYALFRIGNEHKIEFVVCYGVN